MLVNVTILNVKYSDKTLYDDDIATLMKIDLKTLEPTTFLSSNVINT